jgi:ATP-dependent DNA helicase PIF1
MNRPIRTNASVPAPHFSQDEGLSSLGVKRQRGAVIPSCQRCATVHRSDKENDKCKRSADASTAQWCDSCSSRHKSEAERLRCSRRQQVEAASVLCGVCCRRHQSEASRLRCSRQHQARPIEAIQSQSNIDPSAEIRFNRNVANFQQALAAQKMLYCRHCSEAWFCKLPATAEQVGDFYVTELCANCNRRATANTPSHAERFSLSNGMHPRAPPPHLETLTEIEEALISLHAPVLRVFRLRGGQSGFGGSCVALTQDVGAVARSLPRKINDLDVVIFAKSIGVSEEGGAAIRKTFRVRQEVVRSWLLFLKNSNPLYNDVLIDAGSMNALPTDSEDTLHHFPLRQEADVEPLMTDSGQLIESGNIQHMVLEGIANSADKSEEASKKQVILDWPQQSDASVSEFGHPGLFAKCFPSVFPYGVGDPTSKNRAATVALSDGIHHLQKYAYIAPGNKLVWPFAQHRIAPYYSHDVHLRQALLGQSAVFLKQHECGNSDFPSTREELLEALQDSVRSVNILKLINRYAGNCLGTNGYWSRRKEELVSLCESRPPHLWWTLSAADLHWPDLRRFVTDPIHAPHLVDAWFTLRVQEYVTWFFGGDCEWIWWRIEYQSRGSAHVHGCARLKNFVDLDALYETARKGRGAEASAEDTQQGLLAEWELCRIADCFCCAMSPDPAEDALADNRIKSVYNPDAVHPSSVLYADPDIESLRFAELLNKVQRHAHVKSYCGCDGEGCGKCRFHAPWNIAGNTHVAWTTDAKGSLKGTLAFKRNDRWMNSYHPVGMQAWNANMDIKLIYSIECLAEYLCAYATKCEKMSKQALRTMVTCARNFDDAAGAQKLVRSLFIRGHGQRDMSAQEVAHCNMNMPLVHQNVKYVSLDLKKLPGVGGRMLDLDTNAASYVVPSIMEWYGRRCDPKFWNEAHQHFAVSSVNTSLHDFVLNFNYSKTGKLAPRANVTKTTSDVIIVNAFPRIRASPGGKLYPEYCRLQLVLHHPWISTPSFVADDAAVALWESVGGQRGRLDAAIIDAVDREESQPVMQLSADSGCDEVQGLRDAAYREVADTFTDTNWHQVHQYEGPIDELAASLESAKKHAQGRLGASSNRGILLDACQQSVVDKFCASSAELVLLIGAGGTGKSEVLFKIKETLGAAVFVTATTGKAAALIDGATVHCAVNAPVKSMDMKNLTGPGLEKLQERMRPVTHIIIDEFSMINGSCLHWIDQRCRQGKHSNAPFGGLSVLLSGDPAQLAPVGGTPLWADVDGNVSDLLGKSLYGMFRTVFFLTRNYRQNSASAHDLANFLCNYRAGELSEADWAWFESRSREQVADAEFENAFSTGIHLYTTNDQVKERNIKKLQEISAQSCIPVAVFTAKNSCRRAADASNKLAGGLDKCVSLCVGAAVMITQNLWTEQGIVNGASGRVVDFLKEVGVDDCSAVVIDIPKYRGPPLCGTDPERRTWVPIPRKEATWITGKHAITCKRQQFPIALAFAITIHKSQGSSFWEPIVLDIGMSDRSCGSTYVAMSRCTASRQIFHSGYARDRIKKNFDSPAFKCRLQEETRLMRLHNERVQRMTPQIN